MDGKNIGYLTLYQLQWLAMNIRGRSMYGGELAMSREEVVTYLKAPALYSPVIIENTHEKKKVK
jgi:hypothetical protein